MKMRVSAKTLDLASLAAALEVMEVPDIKPPPDKDFPKSRICEDFL